MEVSCLLYPSAALLPGKSPSTYSRFLPGFEPMTVQYVTQLLYRSSCSRMKVDQELIHRRKRGGFLESRMEEKMERHREQ
jgi:hypothetical protein